jgi:hypothetical protein
MPGAGGGVGFVGSNVLRNSVYLAAISAEIRLKLLIMHFCFGST